MSTTLTEFLLVRIAEDEKQAQHWDCDCAMDGFPLQHGYACKVRVLAECEAKRRIIAEWQETEARLATYYSGTEQELHERQIHPEWEYATTETGRKSGISLQPEGEGWEPNNIVHYWTDDDGTKRYRNWERFEHTEEEYWRRRAATEKARSVTPAPPFHIRCLGLPYDNHLDYREEWKP